MNGDPPNAAVPAAAPRDFGAWFDDKLSSYLEPELLWPLLTNVAAAILVAVIVFTGLLIARRRVGEFLVRKADAPALRRGTAALVQNTSGFFIAVTAFLAGARTLPLTPSTLAIIHSIFIIGLVLQAAIWASVALREVLAHYAARRGGERSVTVANSIIGLMARIALWSIAILLVLENLGFDVTALVAGLGIGGIAIGLAAQRVLGDLFASLSIVFDKPFEIGDFIMSVDHVGTVEHIGLKTTRLRSLSGEQIVITNSDLLDKRIRNFKRMAERRVATILRIVYNSPADLLAKIPDMAKDIVEAEKEARFERCHFITYADWSMNFELVYFVRSPSFRTYMDINHTINLAIARAFQKAGILFALPSGAPPRPFEEWQPKPA